MTVFSHERIRITLLPARPSRLNANFDTEHAKERLSGRRGIRARCAVGPKRGDAAQDRHRFRRVLVSRREGILGLSPQAYARTSSIPIDELDAAASKARRTAKSLGSSWMSRLGRARLVAASKRVAGASIVVRRVNRRRSKNRCGFGFLAIGWRVRPHIGRRARASPRRRSATGYIRGEGSPRPITSLQFTGHVLAETEAAESHEGDGGRTKESPRFRRG